jgi:hypothetical protein
MREIKLGLLEKEGKSEREGRAGEEPRKED